MAMQTETVVRKKKYPRVMKTRFEFIDSCGHNDVIRAYANCYGGILFGGRLSIKWSDWDKLVKWAKENRK